MTPNEKYNSGGVPHGGLNVDIYRLADVADNASGVLLGTYKLESLTPSIEGKVEERPDIDQGPNGWWLVSGNTKGSGVLQRNVVTTPTIENGDYFTASVRVDKDGNPVAERFVIHAPGQEIGASYRKQSISVIVDKNA